MKKIIVTILSLAIAMALSVCAFAANDSFDPTLNIETPEEGVIILTVNALPEGVSAELTIPCEGWSDAKVFDGDEKEVASEFEDGAVTFYAEGGRYAIIESDDDNNDDLCLLVNGKMLPDDTVDGVTYNSQTNTLTLDNATIVGDVNECSGFGIYYAYDGSDSIYKTLTIELKGENTVTAATADDPINSAIFIDGGNLIIKEAEKGNGATLNVVSTPQDAISNSDYNTAAAICLRGGNLTIESGTITATGGTAEVYSLGIYSDNGSITIKGGTVSAYGGESEVNSIGIFVDTIGDLIIEGGTVKAYGAEGAMASCGFGVIGECKILNNSTVVAEGKAVSGNYPISAGIFMITDKAVSIDGAASVTIAGKNTAINTNAVNIASGNYTLSVKTSEDGALTTVTADKIDWSETVYFKMAQTTPPSGGYPGGYYPAVTPTTPNVDVDNSSLSDAAQAVGGAINSGSAEIEAETGYTEADIAKLQKDGKLEMTIEKKSGYDAADKKLIDAAIAKSGGAVSGTAVQYFDITVLLKHEDTGAVVATVSDTKKPISITVDLSADLQKAAKDGKHIYVVRCHEGKTTFLEAKLNADKTKVTFSSDQFSTYAVVAMDKKVSAQTFDSGIALYGAMALLSVTGSAALVIGKKRKKNA